MFRLPKRRDMHPPFTHNFRNELGQEIEIFYKDMMIDEIYPDRVNNNINPNALQVWLDNLQESLYNPLLFVFTPGGAKTKDGYHRRNALRYTSQPIRVLGITIPENRELTRMELKMIRDYKQKYVIPDSVKPENHFKNGVSGKEKRDKARLYYPKIFRGRLP